MVHVLLSLRFTGFCTCFFSDLSSFMLSESWHFILGWTPVSPSRPGDGGHRWWPELTSAVLWVHLQLTCCYLALEFNLVGVVGVTRGFSCQWQTIQTSLVGILARTPGMILMTGHWLSMTFHMNSEFRIQIWFHCSLSAKHLHWQPRSIDTTCRDPGMFPGFLVASTVGAWLLRRDLNSVLHHIQDPLNRHQVEHPRPVPLTKADSELPEKDSQQSKAYDKFKRWWATCCGCP